MGGSAPLLATPLNPVPRGGHAEWVAGAGGVRLRVGFFPAEDARGSVILSPGRTEPIEKYFEVVDELRSRGLSVLVHDWRGHGLSQRLHSDPLRGHASGTDAFLDDHRLILDAFDGRLPKPWIALGHSMGGALVAAALLAGERRLSAAVLSAPMMGIQLGRVPAGLARGLAGVMTRLGLGGAYAAGPGEPAGGSFEGNILTHDRRRWDRTAELLAVHPELQLGGVTWSWLAFAMDLALRLQAAGPLGAPVTVVAAGGERLVDNAASKAFVARHDEARYVEIEGSSHEILMETDAVRARFWTEFDGVTDRVL